MDFDYLQYLQILKWRSLQIRLQLRQRVRDGIEVEHDDPLIRELKRLGEIAHMNQFSIRQQQP